MVELEEIIEMSNAITLGQDKTMAAWSSETGAGLHSFKGEGRIVAATEEGIVCCRGKSSMRHIDPIGRWELDKTLGSPNGESPLVDRILSIDFTGRAVDKTSFVQHRNF